MPAYRSVLLTYAPLDAGGNPVVPETVALRVRAGSRPWEDVDSEPDGAGGYEAAYTPRVDGKHTYEWVATFAGGTQDVERERFEPLPD